MTTEERATMLSAALLNCRSLKNNERFRIDQLSSKLDNDVDFVRFCADLPKRYAILNAWGASSVLEAAKEAREKKARDASVTRRLSDAEKYPLLEKYKPDARRQAERLNNPRLKRNTVYRLCTRCDGFVEPRGGSTGHDGHVNPVGMATEVAGGVVLTAIPIVGWVMGPLAILSAGKKTGAVAPTPPHGVCLKCGGKYDSANFAVLKEHALAR